MRLTFEVEGEGLRPELPGQGAALVAFMSFAVSRGFGAQHPLIALADRLHDVHRVPMGPLTTFYEREAEDAEDRAKLEMTWQPAAELRDALERLIAAIRDDRQAQALLARGGAEDLPQQAEALLEEVRAAEAAGKRVRLGYVL